MKRIVAGLLTIFILVLGIGGEVSAESYAGKGYMFTFDSSTLNTYFHSNGYYISGHSRNTALQSLPWLWSMNYDAGEYLNNSVGPIVDSFSSAKILTISTHGLAGRLACPDTHTNQAPRFTYLVGTKNTASSDYQEAISEQTAFFNNTLTVYIACHSAETSTTYGNLVSATAAKNGHCAMGWIGEIPQSLSSDWIEYFFQACYFNNATVNSAAAIATQRVRNENPNDTNADLLANYANVNGAISIY